MNDISMESLQNMANTASSQLIEVGMKLLGALILFLVGRWLIGLSSRMLTAALNRQHLDKTLVSYVTTALSVLLNIILIIAILGYFGVETTSFAALIAAMGIAIGAALAGLLANVAAGIFLIILRPFKVGDFVTAGGVTGTVKEIGLFVTTINTPDNIQTGIGNNKIFSDTIQNFTANPYRRVDLTAQLAHGVDPEDAIARLKASLDTIPNVMAKPAPDVEILGFTLNGPQLAVRPYCHNNHYWQVYFDTNKLIAREFSAAGYPVPEQRFTVVGSP